MNIITEPITVQNTGQSPVDSYTIDRTKLDSEFIGLLTSITNNDKLQQDLDIYLKKNPLTPAALHKLTVFARACLNQNLVVGNLTGQKEFDTLMDRYLILKVELPLGLTIYDMNHTFLQFVDMIDLHFPSQLFRARGGFHMRRISTSTNENIMNDNGPQATQAPSQSMFSRFNFMRRQ